MNTPNLPLSQLTFSFQVQDTLRDFDLSASLWHGQFGRALREEVACIQPQLECKNCMLAQQCDYALLFYGMRPANATVMRRYDTIPVPHIFRIPVSQRVSLQTGDWLNINMVLVGKAIDTLPKIIQTMNNIAAAGLGKQRHKLALRQVTQHQNTIETLLYADGLLLAEASHKPLPIPEPSEFIRLQFVTPYRNKTMKHQQALESVDLSKLLMAIVRRISLLQQFYTPTPLTTDYGLLKALTESAEQYCVAQDWAIKRLNRTSAKQKKPIYTSGVVGCIDLSLEGLEALWSYLYIGQFLNVGQNASMGYGQYRIIQVK